MLIDGRFGGQIPWQELLAVPHRRPEPFPTKLNRNGGKAVASPDRLGRRGNDEASARGRAREEGKKGMQGKETVGVLPLPCSTFYAIPPEAELP